MPNTTNILAITSGTFLQAPMGIIVNVSKICDQLNLKPFFNKLVSCNTLSYAMVFYDRTDLTIHAATFFEDEDDLLTMTFHCYINKRLYRLLRRGDKKTISTLQQLFKHVEGEPNIPYLAVFTDSGTPALTVRTLKRLGFVAMSYRKNTFIAAKNTVQFLLQGLERRKENEQ